MGSGLPLLVMLSLITRGGDHQFPIAGVHYSLISGLWGDTSAFKYSVPHNVFPSSFGIH